MIEIFIPVLFICINGNCEFMQANTYYKIESQCKASLDMQKQRMQNLVEKAAKQGAKGEIIILEGTCINAEIKTTQGRTL
jgi:hypothetical protein